jgi:hypothetical protein
MAEVHLVAQFQNLVENSIGYRSALPLRVHVSCVAIGGGRWQRFAIPGQRHGNRP